MKWINIHILSVFIVYLLQYIGPLRARAGLCLACYLRKDGNEFVDKAVTEALEKEEKRR